MKDYRLARTELVDSLQAKGIHDRRVLQVMRDIRRHEFVPAHLRSQAYDDIPLSIGEGQTISQPYMVAWMTQLLNLTGDERVLEIGTGSGFQSVILSELAKKVYTVERNSMLARRSQELFRKNKIENIVLRLGDGTLGWNEFAPFDRIIVTAGAPSIPGPLIEQLAEYGRMVIPVGEMKVQDLKVVIKKPDGIESKGHGGCVFVPLIGSAGWKSQNG